LVGKPKGKRPAGKPRRKIENNIRVGVVELEWKLWTA